MIPTTAITGPAITDIATATGVIIAITGAIIAITGTILTPNDVGRI